MRAYSKLLSALCLMAVTTTGAVAQAQDSAPKPKSPTRHELSGTLELESTANKLRDVYGENQDNSLDFSNRLAQIATSAQASGSVSNVGTINDGIARHMAGAYLYCTINTGSCPTVLDAILESDVINSHLSGTAECPNMLKFWGFWLKNDMEERQKYLVKTGFLNITSDFTTRERPRYLKCKDTVKSILDSSKNTSEFFKNRYKEGSPVMTSILKNQKFIRELKEREINVFSILNSKN